LLFVFAFAAAHDGGQDHDAVFGRELEGLLDDLLDSLLRDLVAADGAVRDTYGRVEQAQVIVDLGDGANRRAGAAAGGFLLDRDGGAEALDGIDFGALHLVEELARVGGESLDVAPLTFGVDGVEGQRALTRPAQAGDHREAVARNLDVDVLEIVLSRAMHADPVEHRSLGGD